MSAQADRNLEHVKAALAILDAVDPGRDQGLEGFRRFWSEFDEDFETFELRNRYLLPVGDAVLVIARLHARGRASGASVDSEWGGLFRLRDGKIATCRAFASHADVLAEAAARGAARA